jgi:hypothetical protein
VQLELKKLAGLFVCMLVLLISGCVSPKFTIIKKEEKLNHPIRTIALLSDERDLCGAVKVELLNKGFDVVEVQQSEVITKMPTKNPSDVLVTLKDMNKAIDAYLSIDTVWANDGFILTANVRLYSVSTGQTILWFSWRNGYGMTDGIPDRVVKKNLTETAQEITAKLTKNITLR